MKERVRVVKATAASAIEGHINRALEELEGELVDIKVTGAYDGDSENYVAVIIYK